MITIKRRQSGVKQQVLVKYRWPEAQVQPDSGTCVTD